MLNVLGCRLTYQGQVVTNAEARFNNSLRPRKPEGSLGRTAQGDHLDSHTAPELWNKKSGPVIFMHESQKVPPPTLNHVAAVVVVIGF